MSTTGSSSGSSSGAPSRPRPGPPRVLLDANALFLPFVAGTDLLAEVRRLVDRAEVRVPQSVLTELRRLESQGEPHAREALQLAARFPVVPSVGRGDGALVALATRGDTVVTADRELRERLLQRGVDVLTPRDRVRLALHRGTTPHVHRAAARRGNG